MYRSTASTQKLARQAVSLSPVAEAHLWVADEQTAGQGRRNRAWSAPAGAGVWVSFAPRIDPAAEVAPATWSLVGAVAVARVVDACIGPGLARLKWPNDVLVEGRKLAGVLTEAVVAADGRAGLILGVGLNTRLPDSVAVDARARPTDLHRLGSRLSRLRVLINLTQQVESCVRCAQYDPGALAEEWRNRTAMIGRTFSFAWAEQNIRGEVIDLDPQAGLIVRTPQAIAAVPPSATVVGYESDAPEPADR